MTSFLTILLTSAMAMAASAADRPPTWAYGTDPASIKPVAAPPADSGAHHLPGNSLEFTKAQIANRYGPADWYPADHPPMPEVVAHGRKPDVWACGFCHYPNGKGRPENAGVAGFPAAYFVEQMNGFKNGLRTSADVRKGNTKVMIAIAKGMNDDEIKSAADYFASIKWTPWIKVVETATVPKMRTSVGMYLPLPGDEREPIGQRIIETPLQPEATEELRDPRSGFIAYAPIGSVKKGKALAAQCGACHGADLNGLGPVPGIAGRSPSYVVRQMYDMQQGTRNGMWTDLMKPVVKPLSSDDMLNIAAYTASLTP